MLDAFLSGNFLQITLKLRNFRRNHMKDIKSFFSSRCDRHYWLSRTFYRTQISLIGLEKQSFLCPLVIKKLHKFSGFLPTLVSYLNPINPGLFGLELTHELTLVFFHPLHNSFVFEAMRPKFGAEILCDKADLLG